MGRSDLCLAMSDCSPCSAFKNLTFGVLTSDCIAQTEQFGLFAKMNCSLWFPEQSNSERLLFDGQRIVASKSLLFVVLFRRVCSMMFSCVTYLETSNNTFDVFCSIVTCGSYYLIFFFRRFELKGLKVRLMVLNVRFMKTFSC